MAVVVVNFLCPNSTNPSRHEPTDGGLCSGAHYTPKRRRYLSGSKPRAKMYSWVCISMRITRVHATEVLWIRTKPSKDGPRVCLELKLHDLLQSNGKIHRDPLISFPTGWIRLFWRITGTCYAAWYARSLCSKSFCDEISSTKLWIQFHFTLFPNPYPGRHPPKPHLVWCRFHKEPPR